MFEVYNRTTGGTETLLFTTTSDDVNALTPTEYLTSYVQTSSYQTSLNDRLVVKVYGKSRQNNVMIVPEDYTTVTCGCCGKLKNMEHLKVYECSNCNLRIDRDYNGARNICLKTLTPILKNILC